MECQITLSNGEVCKENGESVSWWRWIMNYCRTNNLTIRTFSVGNEILSPKSDAYFIIHDVIAFCGGPSITRKGYGLIRKGDHKAKIIWVNNKGERLFGEIIKPYPNFYEEISVSREKK